MFSVDFSHDIHHEVNPINPPSKIWGFFRQPGICRGRSGDSARFVFGGWDGHDTLDDLYEFSITTSQWYRETTTTFWDGMGWESGLGSCWLM